MEGYRFIEYQLRCITPLHIGCGQDVGAVDLPVTRERVTDYPLVPGSGLRGALRGLLGEQNEGLANQLFGSDSRETISAGCLSVLDGRILLFPVRSSDVTWRWITCPTVLERYQEDQRFFLGVDSAWTCPVPEPGQYLGKGPEEIYLEEFPFQKQAGDLSLPFTVAGVPEDRVVLLSDRDFRYFTTHATLIIQRNRLSTRKTVMEGHLFNMEALPPETVFYGFLGATRERSEAETARDASRVLEALSTAIGEKDETTLFLGGQESVGMGISRIHWLTRKEAEHADA